jgi:two-component system, OmpR family, phosphate regulon sensor histidine kinase PhoR
MIHDIKTPLSTIRLGLGALDHEKIVNDPEKRTKYLQVISTETERTKTLKQVS